MANAPPRRVRGTSTATSRSVIDVAHARELLPVGRLGAVLELAADRPVRYDAWDLESWVRADPERLLAAESVDVRRAGTARSARCGCAARSGRRRPR